MLLWKVMELLQERGIPVMRRGTYLEITTELVQITIEPRPIYCDRGNFLVKAFPRSPLIVIDREDGFPRYYFGVLACVDEIKMWMDARKVLT